MWNPMNHVPPIKAVNKTLPPWKRCILSFLAQYLSWSSWNASSSHPRIQTNHQALWKRKLDWDEELPSDLKNWRDKWKPTLHELPFIEISKWYGLKFPGKSVVELHVFADVSCYAYGAVVYLRFKNSSEFKCSFVIGKLRTVPVKKNSFIIPKSELQVAVTASKIKVKKMEELKVQLPV